MEPHRLDREQARQIAVRAQLLSAERPTELLTVVEQLTLLQVDPTAAIAPNADLVAWSRLGSRYRPEHLTHALEHDRSLFELNALIRPMTDLPLYRAEMAAWPTWERYRDWLEGNERFHSDVLARLRAEGPLASRDIPDTSTVPWASSGWTGNRNVTRMLESLTMRGEVAVSGRRGRERLWDLAERVYPSDGAEISADEAERMRDERRLRALGIARGTGPVVPMEPAIVHDAGEPAVIEGVAGVWRVDPSQLERPFTARTALLSPLDRLVHDRVRALALFDFEFTLEMYKPAAARRWGTSPCRSCMATPSSESWMRSPIARREHSSCTPCTRIGPSPPRSPMPCTTRSSSWRSGWG
ncbi:crosslink repair DNA glycosylase YcaQ family protein [Rathayibacter sp. YIM 133350]|uniref:DNA glycosylase AlkZ-like family protein n=1 Tax=Rathayibacter sp. YIM 133350 TaxID=3131992 RepID=UPI00307E072E